MAVLDRPDRRGFEGTEAARIMGSDVLSVAAGRALISIFGASTQEVRVAMACVDLRARPRPRANAARGPAALPEAHQVCTDTPAGCCAPGSSADSSTSTDQL